jgi:hypothetical protein
MFIISSYSQKQLGDYVTPRWLITLGYRLSVCSSEKLIAAAHEGLQPGRLFADKGAKIPSEVKRKRGTLTPETYLFRFILIVSSPAKTIFSV